MIMITFKPPKLRILGETPFKLRGARACIIMDLVTCLIMGGLLILVILLTGKTGPNFVAAICSETTKVIRLAAAVSFIHCE